MPDSKHVVAFRQKHMKPGEEVRATADGYIGKAMGQGKDAQHNGSLVVSDQRVAFYRKGIFGEVLETIPLKSITSVERKSMLGHRVIRIHTSHDALEFKTFDKEGEAAVVEAIEAGRDAASSPPAAAPAAGDDPLDAIKKLAELRDAGVLTTEEFDQKKTALLEKV